jgi:chloramphenicol O-acetyltransferase type A
MSGFINLDTWKRREHFSIYSQLANPFWNICADVNVTHLWQRCHETHGRSFTFAAIYAVLSAANETEEFRLRIRGGNVWIHDRIDISTTVLREDETFAFAIFPMIDSFLEFQSRARSEAQAAKNSETLGDTVSGRDDLIYHSTVPWIRFTALSNPTGGQDSLPRIVFGRCSERDGAWQMPVSVEVHHALVDGLHVARFFERFERNLASLEL